MIFGWHPRKGIFLLWPRAQTITIEEAFWLSTSFSLPFSHFYSVCLWFYLNNFIWVRISGKNIFGWPRFNTKFLNGISATIIWMVCVYTVLLLFVYMGKSENRSIFWVLRVTSAPKTIHPKNTRFSFFPSISLAHAACMLCKTFHIHTFHW